MNRQSLHVNTIRNHEVSTASQTVCHSEALQDSVGKNECYAKEWYEKCGLEAI